MTDNGTTVTATIPYLAPNGSVSDPAIAFSGATNTGLYLTGSDLAITTSAVLRQTISTTAITATIPLLGAAGTAAAPQYSFSADADSGMYRIGADNLGFSVGTAKRLDLADTSLGLTSGTTAMELRLFEPSGSGTNYTGFKAQAMAANPIYTLPAASGTAGQALTWNASDILTWSTPAGTGDVVGPASATDNALVRFDGITGKLIKNSDWTLSNATGNLTGAGTTLLAAGSVSLPAYSFTADTTTGLYRVGASQIGITTGGTLRQTISTTAITSTLPLLGANGAVGAPQYSFSSETTSGMYRIGTNNPAISAGGAKAIAFLPAASETTSIARIQAATDFTSPYAYFRGIGLQINPTGTRSTNIGASFEQGTAASQSAGGVNISMLVSAFDNATGSTGNDVNTRSNSLAYQVGVFGEAFHQSSATITSYLSGLFYATYLQGSGLVANAFGAYLSVGSTAGTRNATTSASLFVTSAWGHSAGTIASHAGIWIDAPTTQTGTVTNKYAINWNLDKFLRQ